MTVAGTVAGEAAPDGNSRVYPIEVVLFLLNTSLDGEPCFTASLADDAVSA
jgi:hypothetical protein